jgi:hypothetical protein
VFVFIQPEMKGYIYIIHVREFINTNIYKVGRTIEIFKRFKQYPKGSLLLFSCKVNNCVTTERAILNKIKSHICREYGLEYCNMPFHELYEIVQNEIKPDINQQDISIFIKYLQNEKCKSNNNIFYHDQIIYYYQKWCLANNTHVEEIPVFTHNLIQYAKENENVNFTECFYYEKIWDIS